jgi:hypothetical protein
VYTQWSPVETQTSTCLTPNAVIAQQYSSATLVSLCFRFPKKIFGTHLKNVILIFFYFFELSEA